MTKEKLNQQNEMLDEFNNLLNNTKKANYEISDEIKNQKPMLEELDKNIDNVNNNIKNTTQKIEDFNVSNNCSYLIIIWIEIIVMIYIIFGL
jgi:archaellum component FlaC